MVRVPALIGVGQHHVGPFILDPVHHQPGQGRHMEGGILVGKAQAAEPVRRDPGQRQRPAQLATAQVRVVAGGGAARGLHVRTGAGSPVGGVEDADRRKATQLRTGSYGFVIGMGHDDKRALAVVEGQLLAGRGGRLVDAGELHFGRSQFRECECQTGSRNSGSGTPER